MAGRKKHMERSHYSYRNSMDALSGFRHNTQLKVYNQEQKKGAIARALAWLGLAMGRSGKEKSIADNKS